MMFNHKQENILSGYICAGLVSESLSTKVMNNLILEAAACKIVGDCHQAVAINVNRYFSSLQEMIPVLSSIILNNKLPIEELVESTICSNLDILLTDIGRDIARKLNDTVLAGGNDTADLVNQFAGGEAFTADIKFMIESYEFSRKVSNIGLKLCEALLDKVIPKGCGCLFNKPSLGMLLWNHIKLPDREKHLSDEIQKRLKGLLTNVRIQLLNCINDAISEFVFQRYEEICCQIPGKPLEKLALTA